LQNQKIFNWGTLIISVVFLLITVIGGIVYNCNKFAVAESKIISLKKFDEKFEKKFDDLICKHHESQEEIRKELNKMNIDIALIKQILKSVYPREYRMNNGGDK